MSLSAGKKITVISEIAQAHDGSLGILHSYIDALAGAGVDIVKFQMHIAEKESSDHEEFRVNFSYVDRTRYDYWKRMSFTPDEWAGIKEHCEKKGVGFLVSPFSLGAVDILEKLGVTGYKIASGEINNYLMLDRIKATGKEMWISTGMSSYSEISDVLGYLNYPKEKTALFQCATRYPSAPENIGLYVIGELKERFGVRAGFSDHSGTVYSPLAAAALGAEFIECHAVFDKRMFGPDSASSLTIDEFGELVKGVRYMEKALSCPADKDDISAYKDMKPMFGKSLSAARDMKKGEKIRIEDLEDRKPGDKGIPSKEYRWVIGRVLSADMKKGEFFQKERMNER